MTNEQWEALPKCWYTIGDCCTLFYGRVVADLMDSYITARPNGRPKAEVYLTSEEARDGLGRVCLRVMQDAVKQFNSQCSSMSWQEWRDEWMDKHAGAEEEFERTVGFRGTESNSSFGKEVEVVRLTNKALPPRGGFF